MVAVAADVRGQPVLPHADCLELVVHSLIPVQNPGLQEAQGLSQLLDQMKAEPLRFVFFGLRCPLVLASSKQLEGVIDFLR